MSHRVNQHQERLKEHLQDREWSPKEIESFARMVGSHTLMSMQGVLSVLEYQQATDERIQGEKDFDAVFVGVTTATQIPEDFFAPVYQLPDREGEALEPNFQQRFEGFK